MKRTSGRKSIKRKHDDYDEGVDFDGVKRLYEHPTREAQLVLEQWFNDHILDPYPTRSDKTALGDICHMSIDQIVCWFTNRRVRMRKLVEESDLASKSNKTFRNSDYNCRPTRASWPGEAAQEFLSRSLAADAAAAVDPFAEALAERDRRQAQSAAKKQAVGLQKLPFLSHASSSHEALVLGPVMAFPQPSLDQAVAQGHASSGSLLSLVDSGAGSASGLHLMDQGSMSFQAPIPFGGSGNLMAPPPMVYPAGAFPAGVMPSPVPVHGLDGSQVVVPPGMHLPPYLSAMGMQPPQFYQQPVPGSGEIPPKLESNSAEQQQGAEADTATQTTPAEGTTVSQTQVPPSGPVASTAVNTPTDAGPTSQPVQMFALPYPNMPGPVPVMMPGAAPLAPFPGIPGQIPFPLQMPGPSGLVPTPASQHGAVALPGGNILPAPVYVPPAGVHFLPTQMHVTAGQSAQPVTSGPIPTQGLVQLNQQPPPDPAAGTQNAGPVAQPAAVTLVRKIEKGKEGAEAEGSGSTAILEVAEADGAKN